MSVEFKQLVAKQTFDADGRPGPWVDEAQEMRQWAIEALMTTLPELTRERIEQIIDPLLAQLASFECTTCSSPSSSSTPSS